MKIRAFASLLVLLAGLPASADVVADYHDVQDRLDSAILDAYDNTATPQTGQDIAQAWLKLEGDVMDPAAHALVPADFSFSTPEQLAAKIGASRALLEHVAALEMLAAQRDGRVQAAQSWRDMITLPQFGNADDGGLLLQQSPDQVKQPGVTTALAKEEIGWQVARVRQIADEMQHAMNGSEATDAYIQAKIAEIGTLAQFPKPLLIAAGLPAAEIAVAAPQVPQPLNSPAAETAVAAWREKVEATLPNLLTDKDVTRLQRLLARFVEVVPKEYRNGVENSAVVIPLEYKEAVQFTEQAQSLVNELAPVWQRDQHAAFIKHHGDLVQGLATLHRQIDQVQDLSVIEKSAGAVTSVLSDDFGISAHRSGDKGQIIEETALDVRTALNDSLAAAKAGHWQEAESLRLDAYTSFDSEIEIRVMPRNPTLATKTERSFIDGQAELGIKALLDANAPIDQLTAGYERALRNLDECVALLNVSVSPATIAFTTFTILAREGLEAIVILAALLAGLRGDENIRVRRGIVQGAMLGVVASGLTFWLSQTIIRSLMRYGEKLEAVVSVLAVIILFIVTNWVFHKMYWVGWNARLRDLSKSAKSVRSAGWEVLALLGVGFLTVYREGFETTIFMQSLLLEGGTGSVLLGALAGFAFIGTVGALILFFGAKLPYRKLLVFTGLLVVSIMVTFVGSAVRLFQTVGWLPVHPIGVIFPDWVGVWLGLYPSWEGVLIPPLALVYVGGAWLYAKIAAARAQAKTAPPPSVKRDVPVPSKTPVSV
ncbi:MAG TPA: FTR1 family protein [Candidatus Methylacidiphilales bacterium]|jgi:high-affinity iron transporter|nr:FTR1 family protein [Candidatus Methylacidiphilales bacterium]